MAISAWESFGCGDVDDVDLGIADDGAPVGGGLFPAELDAGFFDGIGGAAADGVEVDIGRQIEKSRGLTPGVRVGLAHEIVADHADAEGFFGRHREWREICMERPGA